MAGVGGGAPEGPFPPGRYPVAIVGTGPGGIQLSSLLRRRGVEHALLGSDEGPGGMFRRFPLFERLITWSKPYAPADPGREEYERYDWNSLPADDEPPVRVSPEGPTYFPSRAEMEQNIASFAERQGVLAQYGTTWESTERRDDGFVLHTTGGDYEARVVVFAIGSAEPWAPSTPGLELAPHYANVTDLERFRGRRVFIVGKRNAAFEVGDGLLTRATQVILASPRPANLSIVTRSTAGARARYLQVYEDAVLGGGSFVLDAALDRVERLPDGYAVYLQGTTVPGALSFVVDEVIACTGWSVPLKDLQKHGAPSSSAAVHGFRYNTKVLADHIASTRFGWKLPARILGPEDLPRALATAVSRDPALWNQQAYLTRVFDLSEGVRDVGLQPLQAFVDADGPDAVAATVETTAEGVILPVLYVRRRGTIEEHTLPEDELLDFSGKRYEDEIAKIVKGVIREHV